LAPNGFLPAGCEAAVSRASGEGEDAGAEADAGAGGTLARATKSIRLTAPAKNNATKIAVPENLISISSEAQLALDLFPWLTWFIHPFANCGQILLGFRVLWSYRHSIRPMTVLFLAWF
jgi:hypothetical protein